MRLIALFRSLPKGSDDYGLIHADFHRGNFHVDEKEQVIAFDFDDALHHWFVYDIAVVFFSLEKSDFNQTWEEFEHYFWLGYESQNKISEKLRSLVPDFIKYRRILMYYWCKKNINNPTISEAAKEWMLNKMKVCEVIFNEAHV